MRGGQERAAQAKLFNPKVLADYPGVTTRFVTTNEALEAVQVDMGKPKASAKVYGTTEMEFLERMTYSPATLKKPIKPLKINGLTPPPTPPTPPSRGSSRGSATSLVGRWRPPTSDLLEPVDEDVEATGGADGGLAGGAASSSNPVLLRRSVSGTAADQFARSEVGSQYSGQSSRLSGSGHARPTTALSAVSGMSSLQRLELSRDPTERHQQLQERQRQLQEMEEETALRLKEMEVELSRFVRRADGGLLLQTRKTRDQLKLEMARGY